MADVTKYRSIFISDTHLGSRGCNVSALLDFLKRTESEYLFLVGDIIDFWALKRNVFWSSDTNTVIQKILKKARHGTKVIYIPGNHDESLREYIGIKLGDIELHETYIHTLADGKRVWCLHGDLFDVVTRYHKWVAKLGDIGYEFLVWLNRKQNAIRARLGWKHWSLSAFIKHNVKEAVSFISDFEDNVIRGAKSLDVDYVLCGHIHHAEIRTIHDITYVNTGDFVESCTAIVEHHDGKLELINWLEK